MVSSLVERVVLVPVMRVWEHTRRSRGALGPLPVKVQSVHSPGSDSDRVLLFGSGIAAGWGTLDHDMALAGQLARALGGRTGRGADVEIVVDIALTVGDARARLESVALERYDAIVLVLGAHESFEFVSVARWRDQLSAFLNELLAAGSFDVVIAGIPSLRGVAGYDSRLGVLAERHSGRYNQVSAELSGRNARTTFVALSPAEADSRGNGRATANYRRWGAEIAERTAPLLNASRLGGSHVIHDAVKSEPLRQDNVRKLTVFHSPPEARFDRIVEQARTHLNTSGAALGFIDGDTIWFKSAIGATLPDIAVEESFTRASLSERGAFIVPDAQADPRFRNLVHVVGEPWVRFWAGFPIEDAEGVRVGTLSVFDPKPRTSTADRDRAVLRQLALAIKRELCTPVEPPGRTRR